MAFSEKGCEPSPFLRCTFLFLFFSSVCCYTWVYCFIVARENTWSASCVVHVNCALSLPPPFFCHFRHPSHQLSLSLSLCNAVGPLTNLALYYRNYDTFAKQPRIEHLIVMGGSILNGVYSELEFDSSLKNDYNLRIDPLAALEVLSRAPFTIKKVSLITGNTTLQCWMDQNDLNRLQGMVGRYPWMDIAIK